MKTIILTLVTMATFGLSAQQNQEAEDTTRFKVGSTEFIIINHDNGDSDTILVDGDDEEQKKNVQINYDPEDLTYWSGIDIGINTLLNSKQQTTFDNKFLQIDPSESFNFSLNLMEKRIRFGTDHVGLVTGLGFNFSRYGFKDNYLLRSNSDSTFAVMDTTVNYNKNQLRTTYLNIPLMLHFNTSKKENNNFHVSVGVIGGVRLTSKLVRKYDILGGDQKDKIKGKYNLNPFQLNATARLGYRNFGLFANYSLLPLFENNKIESAYPLTIGASFNF